VAAVDEVSTVIVDYADDLLVALVCLVGTAVLVAAVIGIALAAHSPRWRATRARCVSAGHALVRAGGRHTTR
jgi:hypothetical protein